MSIINHVTDKIDTSPSRYSTERLYGGFRFTSKKQVELKSFDPETRLRGRTTFSAGHEFETIDQVCIRSKYSMTEYRFKDLERGYLCSVDGLDEALSLGLDPFEWQRKSQP